MVRSTLSRLLLVSTAAALAACGAGKPCTSSHDCPTGDACVLGRCDSSPFQTCSSTADCAYGDFCNRGTCLPDCNLQLCPDGQTCNVQTHLCVSIVLSPGPATGSQQGGFSPPGGGGSGAGATAADAGAPLPMPDGGSCADNWASFASGFFTTNCTACHGQFATYSSVVADAVNIQSRLQSGSMPPTGGVSSQDRQRILAWIACGMPETATSGPSAPPVSTCPAATSTCTSATWCNFAQGFFEASCLTCHSAFGSYAGVQSRAGDIQEVLADGSMPPSGGLGSQDLATIQAWLSCGLPQ